MFGRINNVMRIFVVEYLRWAEQNWNYSWTPSDYADDVSDDGVDYDFWWTGMTRVWKGSITEKIK